MAAAPYCENIRIKPESQAAYHTAGEDLVFNFQQVGVLQAGTARLEFDLQCDNGDGATDLDAADLVQLSNFGGAWAVIEQVTVNSEALGASDDTRYAGRAVSTLNAVRFSVGALMNAGPGSCEYASAHHKQAQLITVNTVATPLHVALDLQSLGAPGLFGQNLPLNLMGTLSVRFRLASNAVALFAGNEPAAQYRVINPVLTAAVLFNSVAGGDPKSAIVNWTAAQTLYSDIDNGNKSVSMTAAAPACQGVLVGFNVASYASLIDADSFALVTPPDLEELSFTVGGMNDPLTYSITPISGGIGEEVLELAVATLRSTTIGRPIGTDFMRADDVLNKPAWFVAGAPFETTHDLTKQPFAMRIRSAISAATPYRAYLTFLCQRSLQLGTK